MQVKKLSLSKETLRTLNQPQLGLAAGGGTAGSVMVCTPPIYFIVRDFLTEATQGVCDTNHMATYDGFCTTSA
jgi:hypothetical protein